MTSELIYRVRVLYSLHRELPANQVVLKSRAVNKGSGSRGSDRGLSLRSTGFSLNRSPSRRTTDTNASESET